MPGVTITHKDARLRGRRVTFNERSAGGWWRTEYEWDDERGRWRGVGAEIVTHVEVEIDAALLPDSVATGGVVTVTRETPATGLTRRGP